MFHSRCIGLRMCTYGLPSWKKYGIYLVAVDTLATLFDQLVLDEGESAAALPPGSPLQRKPVPQVSGIMSSARMERRILISPGEKHEQL